VKRPGSRTVVTGGAGFIGSHLVELLLRRGDEVIVIDDLSTGSMRNLSAIADHPRLRVVVGSVTDPVAVRQATRGADRIFHLAAAVGVNLIVDSPLSSLRTNIHGTEAVLDAALETGAEVLLASTSEIYGKNTADRLSEDADRILGSPLLSRWSYAAAKGIDEAFAHAYWNQLGLQVTIVRLFNTCGPRQTGRYGMVVPRLVSQALRGEALTVFGDGRQTRCFSYVGDVVPAMVDLLECRQTRGLAFNLGGAQEISILDLAQLVIDVTGSPSSIVLVPYEEAYSAGYEDMRRRVPDNRRSEAMVGYVPHTPLAEMIGRVADSIAGVAADPFPAPVKLLETQVP
jgi:UDP-glucose 4-epimerase